MIPALTSRLVQDQIPAVYRRKEVLVLPAAMETDGKKFITPGFISHFLYYYTLYEDHNFDVISEEFQQGNKLNLTAVYVWRVTLNKVTHLQIANLCKLYPMANQAIYIKQDRQKYPIPTGASVE